MVHVLFSPFFSSNSSSFWKMKGTALLTLISFYFYFSDELLELHTNITAAERDLYLAVRKVLAEIFSAVEYHGKFSEEMKEEFDTILIEMNKMRIRMKQSWKESEGEIVGALTDIRAEVEVAKKESASTFGWLRQVQDHT